MGKNIFVTGSGGLFGTSLKKILLKKKIKFKVFKKKKFKRYDKFYFSKFFNRNKFTHIINLAAYTDIDGCEKNKKRCELVNIKLVKNICDGIQRSEFKSKLIHFSTDQMYNNEKLNDEKNAKISNFYTLSKIKSEKIALKIDSIILRTNFFGRSLTKKRASFSDWVHYSIKNNNKIYLAEDIYFSPISIDKLIMIVLKLLNSNHKGIYNVGSRNGFSKYQFGYLFAKMKHLDPKYIIKVKKKNLRFLAKRNNDMRMKLNKFEEVFHIKLPNLINELKYIAKKYY
jgi:dTDP-4-dehydrorhamnose reductase